MKIFYVLIFLFLISISLSSECDPTIDILLNKYIYDNEETVYFTPKVYNSSNYTTQYWIEDLNQDIVKNKVETKNSNKKQWTPKIEPKLEQSFIIKANITSLDCNDTNISNNYVEKLIAVRNYNLSIQQIDYSCIEINELFPNPYGDDDAPLPEGEWIELKNNCDEDIDLEGCKLYDDIGSEPDIIISNTNTINNTIIKSKDYLIVYMNGRNLLNNEGFEKIKLYDPYDNKIDEVSYSGSEESLSWSKINNLWSLRLPSPNKENPEEEFDLDSAISIEEIYIGSDDKAKFGDQLRVRVNILRGNTSKYALYLYLEKDDKEYSKKTSINIDEKYKNFTFTIPLQINPNCDGEFENGTYEVVLIGLDKKTSEEIKIEGNDNSFCSVEYEDKKCPEKKCSTSSITNKVYSKQEENPESFTNITGNVIYESSDVKAEEIGLYMFCFIITILLFKKWK